MNKIAIAIGCVLVIIISAGLFIYLQPKEPIELTLNVTIEQKSTIAGGEITAKFFITSNRQATIDLNYTVLSRTGSAIMSRTQSFLVDGTASKSFNIPIPQSVQPGMYWLTTKAGNSGMYTSAIAGFAVVPPKTKIAPVVMPAKNQSKTINQTETTKTAKEEPKNHTMPPDTTVTVPNATPETKAPADPLSPGPTPLSIDETIAKAKGISSSDAQAGADFCKSLQPPDRDTCYSETALSAHSNPQLSGQAKGICLRIIDTSAKDACLANLALAGDFSVCDAINNKDIKDSCNALGGNIT